MLSSYNRSTINAGRNEAGKQLMEVNDENTQSSCIINQHAVKHVNDCGYFLSGRTQFYAAAPSFCDVSLRFLKASVQEDAPSAQSEAALDV